MQHDCAMPPTHYSHIMDRISNPVDRPGKFTARVSSRLRKVRDELGLTIRHLADRSGVSRATISRIERNESHPTAAILNKLSIGLGMRLTTLLDEPGYRAPRHEDRATIATRMQQKLWIDPGLGCRQRKLTPATAATALGESSLPDVAASLQLTHTQLCPGASITFSPDPITRRQQQLWVVVGSIDLKLGELVRHLGQGDCIAMVFDRPCSVRNPGRCDARLLTATAPICT